MKIIVAIESLKNAERGHPKAYLARLSPGLRGDVDRAFAPKEKALNTGNRRAFRMSARPGDLFEARRWWWDADRGEYVGGACWFGIQADGSLYPLTREEAMASVFATRLETDHMSDVVQLDRAERMALNRVFARVENDDVTPALAHG